ncbi:MAG: exodeoxyribonuclease VII large subunit [Bacilli bacterium]|nr:exodeoxyribonuclease VII large subunit [Bacilli bacterium]
MDKKYITVSALTKYIKNILDNDQYLQRVYIKGEISNFKAHTSGHYYFTIKDETSTIKAVMFSFNNKRLAFMPQDGMKVLVSGKISVYEASGSYQIYVEEMLEDGLGNLYIAYEQLKEKLSKEGLFNLEHKKRIPKIPSRVGIITAPTGAAIRDILSTINRRFPICETILFPTLVQGKEAAPNIVKQIKEAEKYKIDVLIIGRGGGSIEDLWPFNEEIVARAIYACPVPIISAVGHEIDFTISDFVADHRAPTPTGAAEVAVPNLTDILNYIRQVKIRASESIKNKIEINKLFLNNLLEAKILKDPLSIYEIKFQKLDTLIDRVISIINHKIEREKNKYLNLINKLEVLSPLNALKRGYAIIKKNNKAITDIKEVTKNDKINIDIKEGSLYASIIDINLN